jgi:hypothetical protein
MHIPDERTIADFLLAQTDASTSVKDASIAVEETQEASLEEEACLEEEANPEEEANLEIEAGLAIEATQYATLDIISKHDRLRQEPELESVSQAFSRDEESPIVPTVSVYPKSIHSPVPPGFWTNGHDEESLSSISMIKSRQRQNIAEVTARVGEINRFYAKFVLSEVVVS